MAQLFFLEARDILTLIPLITNLMTSISIQSISLSSHNFSHMLYVTTYDESNRGGGGGHITDILTPVHTSPDGFQCFTLNTHPIFPVHTMLQEF